MSDKRVYSDNPRVLAVQTLAKIKNGAYSNLQLNQVIKQHHLGEADTRLLTTLVTELLYTALFQMVYLDKIPQHAIFNESIEVAKVMGHVGTAKFVTAILHNIDRQGLQSTTDISDTVTRLSVEASLPVWLIETLINQNGETKTRQIVATINDAP